MTRTIGLILCVVGVIGLVWGGVTYTTREKVVDLGPIEITSEKKRTLPLPPIIGVVALIGGIGILLTSKQTSG